MLENIISKRSNNSENIYPVINNVQIVSEITNKISLLKQKIEEARRQQLVSEIGLDEKTGALNIDKIIESNTSLSEKKELGTDLGKKIKKEVVREMNEKIISRTEDNKKPSVLKKVTRKVKVVLLAAFAVANFGANASFVAQKPAEKSRAYDNVEVRNLKAWENMSLYEDEINKLDNILIINKANKDSDKKYLIIDKSTGAAHLYQGDTLITTYEVGTGQNVGDDQTKTIVDDGQVLWDEGNKQTGAGIYTISRKGTYEDAPSWNLVNERNIEVPTAFHKAPSVRNIYFNNNDPKDNRMSNGCINFQYNSLSNLEKQKGFGVGTKVYILPDDKEHNRFQIIDGELRFIASGQNVNKTTRSFNAKPIVLKVENRETSDIEREFLDTISNSKQKFMNMYPTVSNNIYNQIAKIAYGILGQESSFGTYGGIRGQFGKLTDYAGSELGKNVSAGVTQVRITSIDQKVKDAFSIKTTEDLFEVKNSAIATMGLLLEIYTSNIPLKDKDNYIELLPYFYNNPVGFQEAVKTNSEVEHAKNSTYVKKVLDYSKDLKVYSIIFR